MANGGGRHSVTKDEQSKAKKLATKKQKDAKDRQRKSKTPAKE